MRLFQESKNFLSLVFVCFNNFQFCFCIEEKFTRRKFHTSLKKRHFSPKKELRKDKKKKLINKVEHFYLKFHRKTKRNWTWKKKFDFENLHGSFSSKIYHIFLSFLPHLSSSSFLFSFFFVLNNKNIFLLFVFFIFFIFVHKKSFSSTKNLRFQHKNFFQFIEKFSFQFFLFIFNLFSFILFLNSLFKDTWTLYTSLILFIVLEYYFYVNFFR